MLQILAISGSLRATSSNAAILRAAIELAPSDMNISIYEGLGDLPPFNPDLDNEAVPVAVKDWRDRLQTADGVIFCTPEYAHGVPGVLKNALDWIVSSGEFMHKPTAVISASPAPDGGAQANASLVQTLTVMMASIDEGAKLLIPAVSARLNPQGEIIDPETTQALQSLLKVVTETIVQVGT